MLLGFIEIETENPSEICIQVNSFHLLITTLKLLLWNPYTNSFFKTSYFSKIQNIEINCTEFYKRIIEVIQMYDTSYINDFICFHFYGLFYDKLINNYLKNEWNWNLQTKIAYYNSNFGDYTKEEFIELIKPYLSTDKIELLVSNIPNYKKIHLDFIKYLNVLNNILINESVEDLKNNDDAQFQLIKNNDKQLTFLLFNRFNNPFDITDEFNLEQRRLLRIK